MVLPADGGGHAYSKPALAARYRGASGATGAQDTTLRPLRLAYCWASELDLMARLAGLGLRERYRDWDRGPFTGESQERIWV